MSIRVSIGSACLTSNPRKATHGREDNLGLAGATGIAYLKGADKMGVRRVGELALEALRRRRSIESLHIAVH